jgi:homeobox protein ESX1
MGEQRPRSGPVYGCPFDPQAMLLPEPPVPVLPPVPVVEPLVVVVVDPPPAPFVVLPVVVLPVVVLPVVEPLDVLSEPPAPPELVSPPVREEPAPGSLHA